MCFLLERGLHEVPVKAPFLLLEYLITSSSYKLVQFECCTCWQINGSWNIVLRGNKEGLRIPLAKFPQLSLVLRFMGGRVSFHGTALGLEVRSLVYELP